MGIRLVVEVLQQAPTTLTHREKLLLVALAEDANEDTRVTWGSVEAPKILRGAQLTRAQLYAVLKTLAAKGVIAKLAAGQRNSAAKYKIENLSQCPQTPDTEQPQCPGIPDPKAAPEGQRIPDTDDPQCPQTPDTEPEFSVRESQTLTDSQCQEIPDFSVSESLTPTPLPSRERSISTPSDRFAEFWTAYPRKVSKPNGRKAWDRALKAGADPEMIIAAVPRHVAHWKALGREIQYIPHPSTWLNGESWDDDLPAVLPTAPAQRPQYRDPSERGTF